MRLLELEISNVRGMKDVVLRPSGKNLVIWGPNGSGKSAVVDALDFLLTGKISRLIGEGTAGITLKAHGPHVDHKPEEAFVRALISIPGIESPFKVGRCMATPSKLEYPPEARDALLPILDLAEKGQHVLSRRQILRFIAAEAGKRANDVQALLNLSQLEDVRKALIKADNQARQESNGKESIRRQTEEAIKTTLGFRPRDKESATAAVNELRAILQSAPILELSAKEVKSGLVAPANRNHVQGPNPALIANDQAALDAELRRAAEGVKKTEEKLRSALSETRADKNALDALTKLQLYQIGEKLIDESETCPLCGTPWPPGKLIAHIRGHVEAALEARNRKGTIDDLAEEVAAPIRSARSILLRHAEAARRLGLEQESANISEGAKTLEAVDSDLKKAFEKYPGQNYNVEDISHLFIPERARESITRLVEKAQELSSAQTPEQTAWDTLTRLEENLTQYESAQAQARRAKRVSDTCSTVASLFQSTRDDLLSATYKKIETRFTNLYRRIHQEDESHFESAIHPQGAGLTFEVDFYGRGKFPPTAVHSEGHQDTMGICLYLALAEELNKGHIELTILDDVLMSVDAGHRRKICRLLTEEFPDRQFLITTHDKTWARELETTGLVKRKDSVGFLRWSIDLGPIINVESDLWSRIDNDMKNGDIPAAAHRLRRGAEEFFELACESLRGKITYRSDGRYELSDFCNGAISAYKKYLKKAKLSAQSWGQKETKDSLEELETISNQIIQRSQVEQWVINDNVHYNHWEQFHRDDFNPVVEAWRDLCGLFQCSDCGAVLRIVGEAGGQETGVQCLCTKVNWNLTPRK